MKKSVFYDHIECAARQEKRGLEEMLKMTADLGYEGVDMGWQGYDALYEAHRLLQGAGLSIASMYRIFEKSALPGEKELHTYFETLASCGCVKAMIVPWRYTPGCDRETEFAAVCAFIQGLIPIARQHGVTVSVEDFDHGDVIVSDTASLKRVFDAVPELRHTFDTGNYIYFGEDALAALDLFIDRVVHVHLKDRAHSPLTEGDGGPVAADGARIYTAPVGGGFLPIEECLRRLHKAGYEGYISAEHADTVCMWEYIRRSSAYIDTVLAALSAE